MNELIRLGVDLKQTPGGAWAVIEINGSLSGVEGFVRLFGQEVLDQLKREGLEEAAAQGALSQGQPDNCMQVFYGEKREIPPFGENQLVRAYGSEKSGFRGSMLRERMSRWWKGDKNVEKKGDVLRIIDSHLLRWSMGSEGNMSRLVAADEEASAHLLGRDPWVKTMLILNILWNVSRFGVDEELGLIFENQSVLTGLSSYDLMPEEFGEFMKRVYKDFPLPDGPKVVVVDEHELDGNLWVHPDHTLISDREEFFKRPDGSLSIIATKKNPKIEALADDKILQKEVLPKQYLAPYIVWKGNFAEVVTFINSLKSQQNNHPLTDLENYPYLVIKHRTGSHGDKVHVLPIHDEVAIRELLSSLPAQAALIEAFVPSKDIVNEQTGEAHDGCMRYLIEILTSATKQEVATLLEVGYWRLAPAPLMTRAVAGEASLKVNLTGEHPAIPQGATPRDLRGAQRVVGSLVQSVLRFREKGQAQFV